MQILGLMVAPVRGDMRAWQGRPSEAAYAVMSLEHLLVKSGHEGVVKR
ncbi:MAG: hypothetical protein KC592_06410 [Nitrospira sp.]|nr:hypothetical protein [Nitrospira sp.]